MTLSNEGIKSNHLLSNKHKSRFGQVKPGDEDMIFLVRNCFLNI